MSYNKEAKRLTFGRCPEVSQVESGESLDDGDIPQARHG